MKVLKISLRIVPQVVQCTIQTQVRHRNFAGLKFNFLKGCVNKKEKYFDFSKIDKKPQKRVIKNDHKKPLETILTRDFNQRIHLYINLSEFFRLIVVSKNFLRN